MTIINALRFAGITLVALACGAQLAVAATHMADDRISDIVNTKHNFSAIANPELPTNDKGVQVKATTQKEVCVFCHTPHGDPAKDAQAFLWNHKASTASTYTTYSSSSMAMSVLQPGEASKMCLSCHDGTVAVGAVDVFNGQLASKQTPASIEMTGDGQSAGFIVDSGTGYNSNLGTDLTNDHPVGVIYDDSKIVDGVELVKQADADYLGPRTGQSVAAWNTNATGSDVVASTRIALPLEKNITTSLANLSEGTPATFSSASGSIECTTCHDPHIRSTTNDHNIKFLRLNRFQEGSPSGGSFSINQDINCLACHKKAGWSTSAHGSITHGDEVYDDTAADDREFPRGIKVSEASCLNCHDAHTEEGARYLLREGADANNESAIENTCFQCHSTSTILTDGNVGAKDVASVVATGGHNSFDFSGSTNEHDATNSDLIESKDNIRTNRHVTCTDCHNPHRLTKNAQYDGVPGKVQATHDHSGTAVHSNTASGSLRGSFGVDPDYAGSDGSFDSYRDDLNNPLAYTVLSGDPSVTTTNIVTKEYQVCLKCHSGYGLSDTDIGVGFHENTAAEFMPLPTGEPSVTHNSWHPVTGETGRTSAIRGAMDETKTFETPFNAGGLGAQTMYCSDCHTNTAAVDVDTRTTASGPHGGAGGMLLASGDALCDSCHVAAQYSSSIAPATVETSGFSCSIPGCITSGADQVYSENLHVYHRVKGYSTACTDCHVARPHGWSNKALLANIEDAGQTAAYTAAPYYQNAQLRITAGNFKTSGNWDIKMGCSQVGGCHDGTF